MGLDVGDRRIGIAVSDALGLTAQGLPTYRRAGSAGADADAVAALFAQHGSDVFVVGLPRLMSGEEGTQAARTREFAGLLRERGARVVLWDERLTTVAAERFLIEGNMRRSERKGAIDRVAASLILQSWLDAPAHVREREIAGQCLREEDSDA